MVDTTASTTMAESVLGKRKAEPAPTNREKVARVKTSLDKIVYLEGKCQGLKRCIEFQKRNLAAFEGDILEARRQVSREDIIGISRMLGWAAR